MDRCVYIGPDLTSAAVVSIPGLAVTTERHRLTVPRPALATNADPLADLERQADLIGAVIEMEGGWPGSAHLRFASRALRRGLRVWAYWPDESAVECLDRERIRSYWRVWATIGVFRVKRLVRDAIGLRGPEVQLRHELADRCTLALRDLSLKAAPVPFEAFRQAGTPRVRGRGAYLRTDYWVSITSGGSYGHTCYVAKELAATSDHLTCFMANAYPLLDDYGLQQVVMPKASDAADELGLLGATWHYYPILRVAFELQRPSYIYERLCLGNFAGALVSRELEIPYIVEYNGSEISMSRSFDATGYFHEDVFIRAEDMAFRQATLISVVSQVVRDSLIARGVDAAKILVNPNGADPAVYRPPDPAVKQAVRQELGFGKDDCVVGFSGTFGGWHGIDVLTAAIPRICERAASARFLLIGDGSHKPQLDEAVAKNHLEARVKSAGRIPQSEGARLLAACDLFVSPHNSHMVDSRFFGSPTKLFEYMAMGRGVVGSDLEQLGEVLSPAMRAGEVRRPGAVVASQRAVLTTPGDVDEFVDAVTALVERPEIADALGRNARQAVLDCFSWQRHVGRVWDRLQRPTANEDEQAPILRRVSTGDAYKEEVQNQWNHNPVGTQYAKQSRAHTLDWFLEIESHRYGVYGPWMPEVMEFDRHADHDVLEIGAGVGTDLSRFARNGARVTDLDLSAGHLEHAKENFALRGLTGRFIHYDAEGLPFDDDSFDLVYSNGVLHHTPNTTRVVEEIRRVLRPGGRVIVMMYAENSLHYWWRLVWKLGLERGLLRKHSIGEVMSRHVEITQNDARPLVKVYSAARLRRLFEGFEQRAVYKRQLTADELPDWLKWVPLRPAERLMGWNLIIKATKPRA